MTSDVPAHLHPLLDQIDTLSVDELKAVNHYIVKRSKNIQSSHTAAAMARFRPGDQVSFHTKQGEKVTAIVLRTNKKTVSLVSANDERWNVAPELLTLEEGSDETLPSGDLFGLNAPGPVVTDVNSASSGSSTGATSRPAQIGRAREWIGGMLSAPGHVTGEPGKNYRPLMPVWMNEIGQVVGMDMLKPSELPFDHVAFLRQTIKDPKVGESNAPSHVRVDDEEIARAIRDAFPSIDVSCAATPELTELQQHMNEDMSAPVAPLVYSEISTSADSLDRFFDSCASLYRFAPWKKLPHDQCLVGVTVVSHGIKNGVISVIGQLGQSFGFLLFDDLAAHEQFTLMDDALARELTPGIPPHRALSYDKTQALPPETRKDIAAKRWDIAGINAYPILHAVTPEMTIRELSGDDIVLFDVLAQSLQRALDNKVFIAALLGDAEHALEFDIPVATGDVQVKLTAPYPYERISIASGAVDDLIGKLLRLDRTAEAEPDWDAHNELSKALFERYQTSGEYAALDNTFDCATLIMDFAFNYLSCTVATIEPLGLEEILLSIIPRKVMVDESEARAIFDDARAFMTFLAREYKLERANVCLELLDQQLLQDLTEALGDSSNFGIGKSIFSGSHGDIPFDLPPLQPAPGISATKAKPADKKSRKRKRNSSRKARRKNR